MTDDKDKLIVRQVAFKGAIESLPGHVKFFVEGGGTELADNPSAKQLVQTVKWLTNEFEKLILKQ